MLPLTRPIVAREERGRFLTQTTYTEISIIGFLAERGAGKTRYEEEAPARTR